jgi:hypothetical protein
MSRTEEGTEKWSWADRWRVPDCDKFNCSKYANSVNVSWWGEGTDWNRLPLSAHNACLLCVASTRARRAMKEIPSNSDEI